MVYFYTKPFLSIYVPKSPISFLDPVVSVVSFFYLAAFLIPVGPQAADPILWNFIDTLGWSMAFDSSALWAELHKTSICRCKHLLREALFTFESAKLGDVRFVRASVRP